MMMMMMMWKL